MHLNQVNVQQVYNECLKIFHFIYLFKCYISFNQYQDKIFNQFLFCIEEIVIFQFFYPKLANLSQACFFSNEGSFSLINADNVKSCKKTPFNLIFNLMRKQ
ncbi:hypothetical protein ABPG72_012162 [Tetrahymena utriculariae]